MPVLGSSTAGSGDAPQQFRQPSRKGKKAWRKNVDLTEVETGLVELNEEIIRGGVVRERASEDLFTIDVQGDSGILKKLNKPTTKGLRADEIINQRSAVAAVSMRKRPAGDNIKITDGIIAAKRLRPDWVSCKELARLKKVADGQHDSTISLGDATYDVWGASSHEQPKNDDKNNTNDKSANDFIEQKPEPKVPKSMRQRPVSLLANGKHAPAVPKPSGGYSYNPLFADYEARLARESAKAIEAEEKRSQEEAAEQERQTAAARSAAEADAAEERANMSEWEEDSEWEGFQSGVEDDKPTKKQPKRKTQAQRNSAARRKEDERLAKQKAAAKARRAQEQRISEIALDVALQKKSEPEPEAGSDSDVNSDVGEEKLRRRQLGKYKLPAKDLELVLPDELQDSLRLLKPEGNLLRDRYRSLLLRGKVESRRHIPFKKQANKKATEKWTHKDFVL